jgi:hypothetical protein
MSESLHHGGATHLKLHLRRLFWTRSADMNDKFREEIEKNDAERYAMISKSLTKYYDTEERPSSVS